MNKFVVNLLPVADGGGLQNALSFLKELESMSKGLDVDIVARSGGGLAQWLNQSSLRSCIVEGGAIGRLKFELSVRRRFRRGTVCFTLFGPPMLGSVGYFVNINGCAYSNLLYPEICFWQDYSGISRFKRELIDIYRRKITALADIWIFETEVLAQRAKTLCRFPGDRVKTVRMAASALVSAEMVDVSLVANFKNKLSDGFNVLFLNGPNRNKRLQNLPQIAKVLFDRGFKGIQFVTTLPESSDLFKELNDNFSSDELRDFWINVGPINQSDASSLISSCDAMATFSRLESFSNNFVEAWRMKKALLVTDADWARSACGDGAVYVDPDEAASTAEALVCLARSDTKLEGVVRAGEVKLTEYPTVAEKNQLYLDVISEAVELGHCPADIKRLIKWPRALKTVE